MSEEILDIEKAGQRNLGKLQKKVITNKSGKKQTVYVSNEQEQPKEKPAAKEDEEVKNKKPVASGEIKTGAKVTSESGKTFTVKKPTQLDFHHKDEKGNLTFEHEGVKYTIHENDVQGGEKKDGEKDTQSSKTSEADKEPKEGEQAKTNEHGMTEKDQTRATNIGQRIKESLGKFSKEQKAFFDTGQFLQGSDTRTKMADFVKAKSKGIVKALKHEVKEVKSAASGIKKALTPPPRPEITHHEKDAMKAVGKHLALTVGSMVATGGVGSLAHGVLETAGHIVVHFLEHVGIMSAAKALAFAKAENEDKELSDEEVDKILGQLVNSLAKHMKSGKIDDKEWVTMFAHSDSMNKELGLDKKGDKEDKSEEEDKDVEKGEKVTMDKEAFVKEHKKLLKVLKSPSKKDDKEEYEEQKKELKDMTKSTPEGNERPETMPSGFSYENFMTMSKGVKREDMPQVEEENIDDFLIHFSNNNAKISKVKKPLNKLKPTQGEISDDKILKNFERGGDEYKTRKYIISKDNYILDGHHSWATGLELEPEAEVDCYKVNIPIDKLLRRTKMLKISGKRDIKDNVLKKALDAVEHILDNPDLYSEEDFEKAKRFELVTVHGKKKTFVRKQLIGKKDELSVKSLKDNKGDKWFRDLNEKYKLSKLPIGIPKEKVTVDLKGDVNSKAIMRWTDPKSGAEVRAYTKEFMDKHAQQKWKRVSQLPHDADTKIIKYVNKNLESQSDVRNQSVAILGIIAHTGLRPGSRKLYQATKNRGISTLSPENVTVKGDIVSLDFKGKSYKQNKAQFQDAKLANFLTKLKKKNKGKEFLFDVSTTKLSDGIMKQELGLKGFKLKDLRTFKAAKTANDFLYSKDMPPPPVPEKGVKKAVQSKLKKTFEIVSGKLNNTPSMAKKSYVPPVIIETWIKNIGLNQDEIMKALEEDEQDLATMAWSSLKGKVDVVDDVEMEEPLDDDGDEMEVEFDLPEPIYKLISEPVNK